MALALSSGGLNGIPYLIGALDAFQRYMFKPTAFVGTSAGAIIAFWHALGYTAKDMIQLFTHDVSSIENITYDEILHAYCNLGMFNTNTRVATLFEKQMENVFGVKDMNWKDFNNETSYLITFVATNMQTTQEKWFNATKTPQTSVIKSLCASCNIPFLFQPIKIDNTMYIDGVFTNNLPLSVYPNSYGIVLHNYDTSTPQTCQDIFLKLTRCLVASQTTFLSDSHVIPIYITSHTDSFFSYETLSFHANYKDILYMYKDSYKQVYKWFKDLYSHTINHGRRQTVGPRRCYPKTSR